MMRSRPVFIASASAISSADSRSTVSATCLMMVSGLQSSVFGLRSLLPARLEPPILPDRRPKTEDPSQPASVRQCIDEVVHPKLVRFVRQVDRSIAGIRELPVFAEIV